MVEETLKGIERLFQLPHQVKKWVENGQCQITAYSQRLTE